MGRVGDAPVQEVGLVVVGDGVEVVQIVDEHTERFSFALR